MIQAGMFSNSLPADVLERFLQTSIIDGGQGRVFSKKQILSNSELLYELAESLSRIVDPDIDAICALAMSGLPLGTLVAQIMGKPLVFFRGSGLVEDERTGERYRVLPEPRKGLRLALVDLHIRSGFTGHTAWQELTEDYKAEVVQIVSVLDFDLCRQYTADTEYTSLGTVTENIETLCKLVGLSDESQLVERVLKNDSSFWDYPLSVPEWESVFEKRRRKASQYLALPWMIPQPNLVHPQTKALLDSFVSSDNVGIWNFFTKPQEIAEVCKIAGRELRLHEFDLIVGSELLGAVLAIALAYHNEFRGQLAIMRPEYGLVPKPVDWKGKRALLCQVRLQYGTYAIDAYEETTGTQAVVDTFLFGRTAGKWGIIPRHLRQTSIRRLASKGVRLMTLS